MITLTTYADARDAFRSHDLRQALYDEGEHLMEGVIVNLHGRGAKLRTTRGSARTPRRTPSSTRCTTCSSGSRHDLATARCSATTPFASVSCTDDPRGVGPLSDPPRLNAGRPRSRVARMAAQASMLVTGGARGLGAAIARVATEAGYRVGVLDVAAVGGVASFVASVSDEAAVDAALDAFGTPDVVVNNAGIVRFGPLVDLALDDLRAVVEVNLVGTFVVARAAARRWIGARRPGCIVNVTSMNGVAAGPNAGAYGATKAAVALLTAQMALEWGRFGIRVNAVAPGLIDAGMSEPIYADPATRRAREAAVPLGRLGTAEDVAHAVLFLASERAAYVHGQNLLVDGGVTGSVIAHLPRPASVDTVGHDQ